MFQEQVVLYMNPVSQYYSHSTFHTPHSTLLNNIDAKATDHRDEPLVGGCVQGSTEDALDRSAR